MSRKLLIAIDIQKDFVEGGALPYGFPFESNTQKVMEYICNWKKQGNDDLLLSTKDTHDDDYGCTLEGKNLPVRHCIKGSEGWKFLGEAATTEGILGWYSEEVFLKPTFGTFKIKEWVEHFEKTDCEVIDEIQIIGYDLAVCVLANAVILRAAFPNKKIVIIKDLCGCINKKTFDAAVTVLKCQQIEVV